MTWEWGQICRVRRSEAGIFALHPSGLVLVAAALIAVAAAAFVTTGVGIGLSLAGASVVFLLAVREPGTHPIWLASGALWIALPCVLLLWLAQCDASGRFTLLWIL